MGDADQIAISGNQLFDLIPQRPPMILIDALVKATDTEFESVLTVTAENLFVKDHQLQEAGLVENIAQTSAAGFGRKHVMKNQPIPIGFIGAVQNLNIVQLPQVDDQLKTVVHLTHTVGNISVVKGTVYNQDRIAAECDMKLFLKV